MSAEARPSGSAGNITGIRRGPRSETVVDVAIVGAGFGGLGMGIQMRRRGFDSFLVLERAHDVGGTWRDNTYPGVACDIPSLLYSFSFRQKPDWSRRFAPGSEIQEYLRECAREEGILPHIRFNTEALQMGWDDQARRWIIVTSTGRILAKNLVVAAGRLSEPRVPSIPGINTFSGEAFHTSRWNNSAELRGKRIGVVGAGASSVQVVPTLANSASELVIFQRSAPYIVPRNDAQYTEAQKRLFSLEPETLNAARLRSFWKAEEAIAQRVGLAEETEALRLLARSHLENQVSDTALRQQLTPDYVIGCKRVLLSNDFYPAVAAPHVSIETSALTAVNGSRVYSQSGRDYDLDVLIFATGFHSTRPPFARRVVGRDGKRLSQHWSNGMTAFASTTVRGFPNFFVINGPNASLGHNSAVYMIEVQIDYILGALEFCAMHNGCVLEVSAEAEERYTRGIDAMSSGTVWTDGGCQSWYVDSLSGRLTLLWPDFAHTFRAINGTFDPSPYELAKAANAN